MGQRLEVIEQGRGSLAADAGDAGNVVDGIAHQSQKTGHALGLDPETIGDPVVAEALVADVIPVFIAGPDQQTIPRQMWNGIREQISPAILAVATLLVIFSIALLTTVELLRRRSEKLRGLTPR